MELTVAPLAFNRTIVELKYGAETTNDELRGLLIVP